MSLKNVQSDKYGTDPVVVAIFKDPVCNISRNQAEMKYIIHKYVFIPEKSTETNNLYVCITLE